MSQPISPTDQELIPYWPVEVQDAICCQFPVGSDALQSLSLINKKLRAIVLDIYRRNMGNILGSIYANRETSLNGMILTLRVQHIDFLNLSSGTVFEIQQSITERIRNLGVPCPRRHLCLEDIPRFNQTIEERNLTKIWVPIRRAIAVEGMPAEDASAQDIRTWMYANQNLLQNIQIPQLDLSGQDLTSVPKVIALLKGLQKLCLHDNRICELPLGVFNELVQLRVLTLHSNQISELPLGEFNQLAQLQCLSLYDNRISELQPGIFNGLRWLDKLFLDGNRISELQPGVFNGLGRLQNLFISNNRICKLQHGVFNGLVRLRQLCLQNNQLSILSFDEFNGLAQLQKLYLYGNPQLLFSYKDIQTPNVTPPSPELNDLRAFREFHTYPCRTPFARFYQFAAQGHDPLAVWGFYSSLDRAFKRWIFTVVCNEAGLPSTEAGRPPTSDSQWGGNRIFEDMGIFNIALKKYVRWVFEQLTDEQKNAVYARVLTFAQDVDAARRQQNPARRPVDFTDPNWGRDHAQDDILRLIDAMDGLFVNPNPRII